MLNSLCECNVLVVIIETAEIVQVELELRIQIVTIVTNVSGSLLSPLLLDMTICDRLLKRLRVFETILIVSRNRAIF